jgi:hypothetical protein
MVPAPSDPGIGILNALNDGKSEIVDIFLVRSWSFTPSARPKPSLLDGRAGAPVQFDAKRPAKGLPVWTKERISVQWRRFRGIAGGAGLAGAATKT